MRRGSVSGYTGGAMQVYPTKPQELVRSLWRNRGLVLRLAARDVAGRYRGSVGGILWSLFNPLLLLVVYTFVFSIVFNARWESAQENRAEFALVLFAGLIVFNLFAECVNRAPAVILSHTIYVKKIVFPLEILPWVLVGSALFHAAMSFAVWLAFSLVVFGLPPASIVLFPLVVVPAMLLTAGFSWILASLGVYLRDTSQVIGIVTTAMLFLSPILYPISAVPQAYQRLLYLNPLTFAIEAGRDLLIWGTIPDWRLMTAYLAFSWLVAWTGFSWFQKTRRGFADVI